MIRIVGYGILFFILISLNACSSKGGSPVTPSESNPTGKPFLPTVEVDESETNRQLWGIWEASFNVEAFATDIKSLREAAIHFNVTQMVPPPIIRIISYDPITKIVEVEVSITNPSSLNGYDVRLIIYTDRYGHMLVDADDWTSLYDIAEGDSKNPFRAYAKDQTNRIFPAHSTHLSRLKILLNGNNNVRFAIDASWPGNCVEPYSIHNLGQNQIRTYYESRAEVPKVWVDVLDWQNDVNTVEFYCPALTKYEQRYPMEKRPGTNTWELTSFVYYPRNYRETQYEAWVIAKSGNSGDLELIDKVYIQLSDAPIIGGVSSVDEYSEADLVAITGGDTGFTYQWSTVDVGTGRFADPGAEYTQFKPAGVGAQQDVLVQVTVDSDTRDPRTVTTSTRVNDVIQTSPVLMELDNYPITLIEVNNNIYKFSYTGQPPEINVNDIIAGFNSISSKGYLRKVTAIKNNTGVLELTTTEADLDEAIEEGNLRATIDFRQSRGGGAIQRYSSYNDWDIDIFRSEPSICLDLDDTDLIGFGKGILYKNGPFTLSFLNPSHLEIYSTLVIEYEGIPGFNDSLSIQVQDVDSYLLAKLRADLTQEYHLDGQPMHIPVVAIPPIEFGPIYINLGLYLNGGFELDAAIGGWLESGYEFEYNDLGFGTEITNNGPFQLPSVNSDFQSGILNKNDILPTTGELYGNAELKTYLQPEIGVDICDAYVLELAYDPYLKWYLDAYWNPGDYCMKLKSYWGHEAVLDYEGSIFWHHIDGTYEFFDDTFSLCPDNPDEVCWHYGCEDPDECGDPSGATPDPYGLESSYLYSCAYYDHYIVATDRSMGAVRIFDINDPSNPSLIKTVWEPDAPWNLCISGSFVYVTDLSDHRLFEIDISDPPNASVTRYLNTADYPRGVAVKDNRAYVVSANFLYPTKLEVIDLINSSVVGSVTFSGYSEDIAIKDNYAYVAAREGGLVIFNISSMPPSYVRTISSDVTGVFIKDNFLYLASETAGLLVYDISITPGNPQLNDSIILGDSPQKVYVMCGYAFVSDLGGHLKIVDVSNSFDIKLVKTVTLPNASSCYGVTVTKKHAYVACDRGLGTVHLWN